MRGARTIAAAVVLLGVAGCTKKDSLVLLDLRASGPLGAPVAQIRLSARGWPTRMLDASLDAEGLRVGYYGPGDGSGVTVTADALDASGCVLGSGSATAPALEAGATSAPTTLFIRPQPANGCVPDAGTPDSGGEDAGTDAAPDAPAEAGADTTEDAGSDAPEDAADDATVDTGVDAAAEAGTDAPAEAAATPDAGVGDADEDATGVDATVD